MRVAVSQFATSSNIQENLAICLRMIDSAAECKPDLIVLPEFCNTYCYSTPPIGERLQYENHNQVWDEAISEHGLFIKSIAERAKKHECFITLNVTVKEDEQQSPQQSDINSNISVVSCLISSTGKLIQQNNKRLIVEDKSIFVSDSNEVAQVTTAPFGQLALLNSNNAARFNDSRQLANAGAQLLCQSTSTFLRDNSELYGAARSHENNLFIAIANKVSSFEVAAGNDDELLDSSRLREYLANVCQSQIIACDGTVLAKMPHNKEGFIFADIDLSIAGLSNKLRPDNTCMISQMRPELYQKLEGQPDLPLVKKIPETVNVAIFATYKADEFAIEDVCHYIENNLSDIIQLPELFFVSDKSLTLEAQQRLRIEGLCEQLVVQVSAMLRPFQYVCTSLILDGVHQAVLINQHGILARQPQLHACQRYRWTKLGDEINIVELPLEQGTIKLSMLTADDANMPELVDVVGSKNIHLLLVPFDIQSSNEVESSLLAQAVEHKFCVVAATREKSFSRRTLTGNSNDKTEKSTGFIASFPKTRKLSSLLNSKKFDGYLDKPIVKQQYGKITKALIHPVLEN